MTDQPPSCNTGVPTPVNTYSGPGTYTIVLDYLAAHVDAPTEDAVDALCRELGTSKRLGRGMHGYSHCAELVSGEDVWCRVFYSHGGKPWLQASGQNAQPVENALRRAELTYRVTRKDAALDLYDAEWFPILTKVLKRYAAERERPLNVDHAGDWQYGKKGRTLYIGSRQSRRFIRLYEKGRKEKVDPNWIRAEVQINAQDELEQHGMSALTAGEIWAVELHPIIGKTIGMSVHDVWEYTPREDAPRRPRRDVERARRALADQYGKTIEGWLRDCEGDPVAFVAELLHAVDQQRKARLWPRAPGEVPAELEL